MDTGMDYETLVRFVQRQFTNGLALVIGSGLSAAEGIPGMGALASHLAARGESLDRMCGNHAMRQPRAA